MKQVLTKLRINSYIFSLRLKSFWSKITAPFQIMIFCVKRYLDLRKIDHESKDRWERHVKIRELESQDELNLHRSQFFCLKVQIIGALYRAGMTESFYAVAQEHPNEVDDELLSQMDNYQEEFKKEKVTLIDLIKKLEDYDGITFDEKIKAEITAWNFEDCNTGEEVTDKLKRFADYLNTLDII